jgi:hypothetical protein
MQQVQKLHPLSGQPSIVPSLRVTTVRPSVWERIQAWRKKTLSQETVAEIILGTVTVALMAWYLVGLYYALESYTIMPMP